MSDPFLDRYMRDISDATNYFYIVLILILVFLFCAILSLGTGEPIRTDLPEMSDVESGK